LPLPVQQGQEYTQAPLAKQEEGCALAECWAPIQGVNFAAVASSVTP